MPNIWNSLTRTGSVGFDEIEEELRRRGIDPATVLGAGQGGGNPALPNTPLALSRMMPPQGGYDDGGGTRGSYPTSQTQAVVAATPDDTQYPYSGREDDPNGKGGLAATITPERSRRRSEVSGEELQMARDLPANEYKAKKKGWWRRLRAGIGDNLRSGGDWFTALTQGVSEAADPSQRAERIKERGVKKIWNRYSQDVQQEDVQQKQARAIADTQNIYDDNIVDQANAQTSRMKAVNETLKAERDLLVKTIYEVSEEFNPEAPENADKVARMKAAGVPIVAKKSGDRFQSVQTANGDLKVFNPRTGEYVNKGNFAKPPTITAHELPDTLFPQLKTKEQIDTEVEASVGPLPEGRRFKPEAAAHLPAQYKNADGTVNEQQLWADYYAAPEFNRPPDPSRYYENLPSNYSQRKAKAMQKSLAVNAPMRQAVDRFRTVIGNYQPNANAQPTPLTKVVDLFNNIMALPPKQRAAKLKIFEDNLPNIRIQ